MRYRFAIHGMPSSELLLRVTNLFVQHGLVVETLSAVLEEDGYRIEVAILGGAPARIELVTEKLRALVLVHAADSTVDLPARVAA